jgi:hypothetical protein
MAASGSVATADIVINPDSKKLAGGPGSLCEVTDIMTNMSFYFTTIRFYTKDGSGNFTVEHLPDFANPSGIWSVVPAGNSAATMYIPDATPVKLTYKARIDANAGQTVDIKNEIWVEGCYDSYENDKFLVTNSGANVTLASGEIMLCKNDLLDPGKHPEGAGFAV